MTIKNIIFFVATILFISFSVLAQAKEISVPYHCPTLKETETMQSISTSINEKDVNWKMISHNNLMTFDKPVEFIKAILERKDTESYGMSVSCVYRTEQNKKFIIIPPASFYGYVDGIAEKALGKNWYVASNGNLECKKSITKCGFLFR